MIVLPLPLLATALEHSHARRILRLIKPLKHAAMQAALNTYRPNIKTDAEPPADIQEALRKIQLEYGASWRNRIYEEAKKNGSVLQKLNVNDLQNSSKDSLGIEFLLLLLLRLRKDNPAQALLYLFQAGFPNALKTYNKLPVLQSTTTLAQTNEIKKLLQRKALPVLPVVNLKRIGTLVDASRIEEFALSNVKYIKRIPEKFLSEVAQKVTQAYELGWSKEQLAEAIAKRFDIAYNHASLIARDQLNKLNTKLTRAHHLSIGIQRYQWVTMGDDRVRKAHRALNGKIFSWDESPSIGHPGEPVNCRCVAKGIAS